jgi:hypothetical protein
VNKKFPTAIIAFILLFTLFSGCLKDENPEENIPSSTSNQPPVAMIIAPQKAYFGEKIVLDASSSYDPDGDIRSYNWDFRDGNNAEGKKVEHIFEFEYDFNVEYPIIYPITLYLIDNDGSAVVTSHQIMIYPQKYMFYLDAKQLVNSKPSSNSEKIKATLNSGIQNQLIYKLSSLIEISECSWNVTIFLGKPWMTSVNRVTITLYDKDDQEVSFAEEDFSLFDIWKNKKVILESEINQKIEFKSLKLEIYGLSISENIEIFYGAEKASSICFDFTS